MSVSNIIDTPILMLNDDCLDLIMRQLSKPDCISFALAYSRVLAIYQQRYHKLFRSFVLNDLENVPLGNWLPFFKFFGHYIEEVKGPLPIRYRPELFENLGKYCINLKYLEFGDKEVNAIDMSKIFPKLTQLESIELHGCKLKDNCLLELNHLRKLKKLNMSFNYKLTGVNMNRLPSSIESLLLFTCESVQADLLPDIFKSLPNLRELNIYGIPLKRTIFQQLVNGNCCDSLQSLTFSVTSADEEYEAIALLPSLKKLTVLVDFPRKKLRPQLFSMLVEYKAHQLEYIKIHAFNCITTECVLQIGKLTALRTLVLKDNRVLGDLEIDAISNLKELQKIDVSYCKNVSNDALIRLILACPKLQVLYLDECWQITDTLIPDLIAKLRAQTGQEAAQRQFPIKMYLYRSEITDAALKHLDVAARQLVNITLNTFDKPSIFSW